MKIAALSALGIAAAVFAGSAQAAIYVDAQTPVGATIVIGDVSDSDMFSLTASGEAFLQNTSGPTTATGTAAYGTNAAGYVLDAGTNAATYPVGSSTLDGDGSGFYYGSLVGTLTLDGGAYTKEVEFFSPGSGGVNSLSTPSGSTFGSVFGDFGSATSGTLVLKVEDDGYGDNTGGFSVAAVPEPSSWILMIAGVASMGFFLRSNRRRNMDLPSVA